MYSTMINYSGVSKILFREGSCSAWQSHAFARGVGGILPRENFFKVLEKCTKNLIGHSRLAFNNHESNIDC